MNTGSPGMGFGLPVAPIHPPTGPNHFAAAAAASFHKGQEVQKQESENDREEDLRALLLKLVSKKQTDEAANTTHQKGNSFMA